MDNVDALGEAMLQHQPEDLRGHNSLHCGDECARDIVRHLYEAGFRITPTSRAEREAIATIKAVMDPLPRESQQKIVARLSNG